MTIPTISVTGNARPPDNVPVGGRITASLSAPDFDSVSNVVVDLQVSQLIGADGAFNINLWPNSRGINNTHYVITMDFLSLTAPGHFRRDPVILGQITLNDALATIPLASIMTDVAGPTPIVLFPDTYGALLAGATLFYSSVTLGLAASANDVYFFVSTGGGQALELWRKVAGVAIPVRVFIEVTS